MLNFIMKSWGKLVEFFIYSLVFIVLLIIPFLFKYGWLILIGVVPIFLMCFIVIYSEISEREKDEKK